MECLLLPKKYHLILIHTVQSTKHSIKVKFVLIRQNDGGKMKVIILFGLALVIVGALITCCIRYLCNNYKKRNPTCSARYEFELDANTKEQLDDYDRSILNESDLTNTTDDVIVIQIRTMGPNGNL